VLSPSVCLLIGIPDSGWLDWEEFQRHNLEWSVKLVLLEVKDVLSPLDMNILNGYSPCKTEV
jgi:hypothetical protein